MPQADVLVVDDSMSARFALTRSLQPHGLNIETAKTAEEALEIVQRSRYDMIFMDHVLPGMTGLDAAEKIRNMPDFAATPIIMCSSNEGQDYVDEALRRGATDVIGKPPEEAALSRVVEKYLAEAAAAPEPAVAEAPAEAAAAATEPEPAELAADTAAEAPTPAPAFEEPAAPVAAAAQTGGTGDSGALAGLDARIERIEKLLEKLEATVAQMEEKTAASARAVADQAGRDLANRLLRAVITLKGSK